MNFQELKKNLKKDFSKLKQLKIALLGDSATQLLHQALKGIGFEYGWDLQIWEADFDQIERQIFDINSELYQNKPEIVIIFRSAHRLLDKYNKYPAENQKNLADNELSLIANINATIKEQLGCKIIYYNYTEIDDSVFGNYATKVESSYLFQLRKINYELMLFAQNNSSFYICDISALQNKVGRDTFFQSSIYINTEIVLSINILPLVVEKTIQLINVLYGKLKKCIILDLDNTVWGGIIGDDGLENIQIGNLGIGKAFTAFQYWVKKLKLRGIIITVCSKNTESIAKEPFEKHPDMVLKLDDIVVFKANWDNKVDNIKTIQSSLNIGFDSIVFIDDNPFERNIVRENISDITVPEMPEDPAEYLEYLYSLNLFETSSYSNEDIERTKLYQIEEQRNALRTTAVNEEEFLKNLQMHSLVESFNKFNIPRVAQLSQRSNQFNLRTIRYTDLEIEQLANNPNVHTFTFTLEDKYGDNGLICVIILREISKTTLFIDTWFMSCRVLKRGMEHFVLNTIVDYVKRNGFLILEGEYIPTAKNEMVKNHYLDLGFEKGENLWKLYVGNYQKKNNHINLKTNIYGKESTTRTS